MTPELRELADQLIAAGQFLFERGSVPATSSNFSARLRARMAAFIAAHGDEPAARHRQVRDFDAVSVARP